MRGEYVQNVTVTSCAELGSGGGNASRSRSSLRSIASTDAPATDA